MIYRSFSNLKLSSIYPIIEGYKEYPSFGLRFNFIDHLGVLGIDAKASYSPNTRLPMDERFHAGFNFRYWHWKVTAAYNRADFYDLFGPTKTSRKGYSLGLTYEKSLLYEKPKTLDLNINISGYAGLDRLPFFQNVASPVEEFLTFSASLHYQYLQKTLGAIEDEKGVEAELATYNYYADRTIFPHVFLNLHYGFLLPLPHSSLWIRSSFGISGGDRSIAFANFYFGGFGNNWIDHRNAQRFREFYSFPGVELNSIEGQNFTKLMAEWTLPPIRFRRFGYTNLYLNWSRLSLFSSGIFTDVQKKNFRRTAGNIGAQLDFKLVFFSYLSSTFSLGYAVAFEKDRRRSSEFMVSLKIL